MRRVASLYLPDLAIDRIKRAEPPASRLKKARKLPGADRVLADRGGSWRPGASWAREAQPASFTIRSGEGALVTAHRDGNRDVLAAASSEARALGLEPGMPLAKARILVRGLDVRPADPEGDAAWLFRLGLFAARRWTPSAAVSGPDGLWLDLSGVTHLFGGERRMSERILAFCRRLGMTARIAVAGTAGAAHALARFGGEPLIQCPCGREADAIAAMPLAALRLDEDALGTAHRLGLERIRELIAMPRAPLQRRFGAALLERLDQALGRLPEPFDPIVPQEPPGTLLRFLEPIVTVEAIEEALAEGLRRLAIDLEKSGLGIRRLVLGCARVDGETQRITIGTVRATRDAAHLHRLLCEKIGQIEPGLGIEAMRLVGTRVEPLAPQPIDSQWREAAAPDLAPLVDRLASRLGARRLYRLSALESDLPERSVRAVSPMHEAAAWPAWLRPVRLLSPPEPVDNVMSELPDGAPVRFRWRGRLYQIAAADGPERLYGEWWRDSKEGGSVRDYFQVEDKEGARFWLFRKGDGDSAATGDHSWHLHGVFA
jgi:protein ImuB